MLYKFYVLSTYHIHYNEIYLSLIGIVSGKPDEQNVNSDNEADNESSVKSADDDLDAANKFQINDEMCDQVDNKSIQNDLCNNGIADTNLTHDIDKSSYLNTDDMITTHSDNYTDSSQNRITQNGNNIGNVNEYEERESESADESENEYKNLSNETENESEPDASDDGDQQAENGDYPVFDNVMFESANVTVRDIVLLTSALALRFHMSDEAHTQIIDLLKLCAGPKFLNLKLSKHIMSKCFSVQNEHIEYHYYCSLCSKAIIHSVNGTVTVKQTVAYCEECKKKNYITAMSPNYFVSVNLTYQINQLLSNKLIVHDISQNLHSRHIMSASNESDLIKDVHGSSIHKRIIESNNDSKLDQYTLTFNVNTDGAPLTKSGKRGFWPLQLTLNDLSPKLRFRFVLLGGILIVQKEPKAQLLNLYLSKTLAAQLRKLNKKRIKLVINGKKCVLKFVILSCVVDSVCRPIVQNRIQFNGYWGCSWCYQRGLYIEDCHGIRYIMDQNGFLRTDESHRQDVKRADSGQQANGVKGYSLLMDLPHIDMVWSFPFEYMHGLLLGVTHQLWKQWKDGKSIYKIKKKDVEIIEKRFLSITPTHEIHRLPRSGIIQGSAKPKGSELKSWLLSYGLPCLNGILHEEALNHFALLVKSAHTLLKYEISEAELDQCEEDLLEFVCFYEYLYGEGSMTFNVHSLQHIVESVRKTGPLCVNSAFPFESYIYNLKTYVNGPKGMDRQMSRKHLQSLTFKTGNTTSSSEKVKDYCVNLFSHKRLSRFYKKGPENITYFGKSSLKQINGKGQCLTYEKCIFKGDVYHSIQYSRAKKTDDTVVKLHSGEFGRIVNIVHKDNQCYLQISLFEIFPDDPFEGVRHIKKVHSTDTKNVLTVPIDNVQCKVLFINVRNASYLSILPNNIEIQ